MQITILLLAGFAPLLFAQRSPGQPAPAQSYNADSRFGELYLLGRTLSTADKTFVDETDHLLVSVESAQLTLRFPTRDRLVLAGDNQQLLLLSGTIKNPQKENVQVSGGSLMTVRFFGGAEAARQLYGQEITVQSESLKTLKLTLKPGESVRYTMALRVPGERPSLKLAILRPGGPIRRYDLEPGVTRARSVFSRTGLNVSSVADAVVGQTFDLDAFDMKVNSVREVSKVGSYASSAGKYLYAAEVQVTNGTFLTEPWGWQYCTPELKDAAGKSIPWSRDMLDAQTAQTYSRDLTSGETATVVYVFSSDSRLTPAALTLMMLKTNRHVEVALK